MGDQATTLIERLRAAFGSNSHRTLAHLLQRDEIVDLLGQPPAQLIADLNGCVDKDLDDQVARMFEMLDVPHSNDARFLLFNILRRAPERFSELFARHAISAPDAVDLICWGSPRFSPPELGEPDSDVLIEILDDDFTPMELVVELLQSHFDLRRKDAVEKMLLVHNDHSAPIIRRPGREALEVLVGAEQWCRERLIGLRLRIEVDPVQIARFVPLAKLADSAPVRKLSSVSLVVWVLLCVGLSLLIANFLNRQRQPASSLLYPSVIAERPAASPAQRQRIIAAFAPFLPALQATTREYARIELTPTSADEPWSSKVGGVPYLPAGASLPLDPDSPGRPMALLAQIDFAELPEMAGYPRQGLLQFFVAEDPNLHHFGDYRTEQEAQLSRQVYFRIVYWPARSSEPGSVPSVLPRAMPLMQGTILRMNFTKATEPITPVDCGFRRRIGVDPYDLADKLAIELSMPVEAVADILPLASGSGHKVGGWPDFAQDDPRSADSKLQLLLQLDSDEHLMWGDAGVANFFIAPEDLANRDFSRVMFNWDSH